jgi:hypothetical protein
MIALNGTAADVERAADLHGLATVPSALLGVVTAVGGGLIRDVLAGCSPACCGPIRDLRHAGPFRREHGRSAAALRCLHRLDRRAGLGGRVRIPHARIAFPLARAAGPPPLRRGDATSHPTPHATLRWPETVRWSGSTGRYRAPIAVPARSIGSAVPSPKETQMRTPIRLPASDLRSMYCQVLSLGTRGPDCRGDRWRSRTSPWSAPRVSARGCRRRARRNPPRTR